jgi:tRNA A37 threonylcarbamoyladenosine dehydratase
MRKELGRRGIREKVKVVYSLEEFRPLAGEPAPDRFQSAADSTDSGETAPGRQRVTLGSSSYVPPIFGLTMAGEVIRELLGDG